MAAHFHNDILGQPEGHMPPFSDDDVGPRVKISIPSGSSVFYNLAIPSSRRSNATITGGDFVPDDSFCDLNNVGFQHQNAITTGNHQINNTLSSPSIIPAYQWDSQSSNSITANGNHPDRSLIFPSTFDGVDFLVADPSPNAFPYQISPGKIDVIENQGHLVPIYALETHRFPQQAATASNDCQPNTAISSLSSDSVYQSVAQSTDHTTENRGHFNYPIIPPSIFDDYPLLNSDAINDGQSHSNFSLPNFSIYNDFGSSVGFKESTPFSTTPSEWNNSSIDSQMTRESVDKLPLPTTSTITVPASISVNTNRLTCGQPGCSATFVRIGDLSRHTKKHGAPQHSCPLNNCNRKGANGFYRLDKLHDHQRKKHRTSI